jgi:hypothetical protein
MTALIGSGAVSTVIGKEPPKKLSDVLGDVYESHKIELVENPNLAPKASESRTKLNRTIRSLLSSGSMTRVIEQIYEAHLEKFNKNVNKYSQPAWLGRYLPRVRFQQTPRDPRETTPYPPLSLSATLNCVNDIWYVIENIPVVPSEGRKIMPLARDPLPLRDNPLGRVFGRWGYRELLASGRIHSRGPPRPRLSFNSVKEFEAYVYVLAFHIDQSPRTIRMLMAAFLDDQNKEFFTRNAFNFAIRSLLAPHPKDVYSARILAEIMVANNIPLDIYLYNHFLKAATITESLYAFTTILREMYAKGITTNQETWGHLLLMGKRLESVNWTSSLLELMSKREIALGQFALWTVFAVTDKLVTIDDLKTMYLQHYTSETFVSWHAAMYLMRRLGENGKFEEAIELLLQEGERERPKQGCLLCFILLCRKYSMYERIWEIIGEFNKRWNFWPNQACTIQLFNFAFEENHISDLLIISEYALANYGRWGLDAGLKLQMREVEKEWGVTMSFPDEPGQLSSLPFSVPARRGLSGAMKALLEQVANRDRFHRVPAHRVQHAKWMYAKKLSTLFDEQDDEHADVPVEVKLWRKVENAYKYAVSSGQWKPWSPLETVLSPQHVSLPGIDELLGHHARRPDPPRFLDGLNYYVHERVVVWEMIETGSIKLEEEGS